MSGHTPGPWRLLPRMEPYVKHPIVQRGNSGGFFVQDDDPERGDADARLIAAAPELHEVADELFSIVAEERECYFESHRNQATGEVPDVCMPYLERLDAALNKARAVFAKATQP